MGTSKQVDATLLPSDGFPLERAIVRVAKKESEFFSFASSTYLNSNSMGPCFRVRMIFGSCCETPGIAGIQLMHATVSFHCGHILICETCTGAVLEVFGRSEYDCRWSMLSSSIKPSPPRADDAVTLPELVGSEFRLVP